MNLFKQLTSSINRPNYKLNDNLEQMAKTIYDYWFVQFEFPNANGKPYKSSGGTMVYNETLKREIPEGWEVKNILEFANLIGGGTPSKNEKSFWNGTIPFFTPSDANNSIFCIKTLEYITESGLKNSSTKFFDEGTIFLTARGSVGKVMINSFKMAMNQSCYALQSKTNEHIFLYYTTLSMIGYLHAKSSGSIFNAIVTNDIKFTPVLISKQEIIEKFEKKVSSLFVRLEINLHQNQELAQLRDWLLPMLMNGQVKVE
ncbi:restriction endonuclease subunit S [Empedobacter sp. GD03739]|uniref:restriction endonuclease subunit S n=1 Tax=Empedobacter sp. GD03739 TaxID=2975376 RepID=UPI002449E194|nr:restriction endonuclease subunit S [Empedobacter sp. GD03739]MDH1603413.1 restriction endonuclease subunit S [Empedobacter sp. GD03739]